ncbi:MAG: gamma carbonic anhydrase family protein [Candidatus Izemoplasmatales bacterium]
MDYGSVKDLRPRIDPSAVAMPTAVVTGDVTIGADVSVWHHAVVRGDMAPVSIGSMTNVQDGAVIHTNTGLPTTIGARVTIGHLAIVHAATVEDDALVGMGAILLDGAIVGAGAMVAAGTVVPPRKVVPPGTLAIGNPMRIARDLTEAERAANRLNVEHYVALAKASAPGGTR